VNLAGRVAIGPFKRRLFAELEAQGDPRLLGRGHVFDAYPYAGRGERDFHARFMRGEKPRAGWVLESDFELEPIAE
jgi:hypothetical protein